jgi:N-acetylmuramoyl-L-alanine amidase
MINCGGASDAVEAGFRVSWSDKGVAAEVLSNKAGAVLAVLRSTTSSRDGAFDADGLSFTFCEGVRTGVSALTWTLVRQKLVLGLRAWVVPREHCNSHVRHVSTYFDLSTSTVAIQNFDRKFTLFVLNNSVSMKNIVRALGILALLVLGAFDNAGTPKYRVKKVVIDAGHGGHDPGALGGFSKEKEITLRIALELGGIIKQCMKDVEVIYTRQTDTFVTLHDRAKIANKNNADVFISVHCNATPRDPTTYGTETYTMGLHTSRYNLEVAKRENSVILMEDDYRDNYQGFNPQLPESLILFSLCQNANNDNSLRLAQNIQHQFENRVGRKSRGVKQAGLLVLWQTTAPSVLVEVGFITHPQEEKYLNSQSGQSYIASGIFRAFRDYKNELEANS